LNVIHEVESDRSRSSGVERGIDSRVTIGCYPSDVLKPGVLQKFDLHFAALLHAAVFSSDRRLMDPILEPSNGLIVLLVDLSKEVFVLALFGGLCLRKREGGGASQSIFQEITSRERRVVGHARLYENRGRSEQLSLDGL
jgi:hypothetical protein